MLEVPQEHPEPADVRVRDTLLIITKNGYFIHHTILLIYTIMLLILENKIFQQFTLSLVLIIVYGLLVVQLLLFNLILIIFSKQIWAVWCNRFIAKVLIILFPLFALVAYLHDHFLNLRSVSSFMIYYCIISLVLIVYQFYSCTWGHHEQPRFIYSPNDLSDHKNTVWKSRKEFIDNKKLRKIKSTGPQY